MLNWLRTWFIPYPWLPFALPLIVFMLGGSLEPKPGADGATHFLGLTYDSYPLIYTLKIVLVIATILVVWPGWKEFPVRVTWWSVLVGLGGGAVWIGLCKLGWDKQVFAAVGLGDWVGENARTAFNPFDHFGDRRGEMIAFLAVRFLGLAVVVPIMEEFFLRGLVMRYVIDPDWEKVPFGKLTLTAAVAGTAVPVLMHLGEPLAALVWFTGITGLMAYTRRIWDCIVAHAATNAVLGAYVLWTGSWELW